MRLCNYVSCRAPYVILRRAAFFYLTLYREISNTTVVTKMQIAARNRPRFPPSRYHVRVNFRTRATILIVARTSRYEMARCLRTTSVRNPSTRVHNFKTPPCPIRFGSSSRSGHRCELPGWSLKYLNFSTRPFSSSSSRPHRLVMVDGLGVLYKCWQESRLIFGLA